MIGNTITELDSVDSTNNYIAKALEKGEYRWGTAILAHFQTDGRGQRASSWQSGNRQNLTFSFALPLNTFDSRSYFSLSRAISLAIVHTIKTYTGGKVHIKWPNDVLVDQKKIAGVLIETKSNENHAAICGIGLNINQTEFSDLPNATSLKLLTGTLFDTLSVLDEMLIHLNQEWDTLYSGDFRDQKERYEAELFGNNQTIYFVENEQSHKGKIIGTTEDGRLMIKIGKVERAFLPKSIKILY